MIREMLGEVLKKIGEPIYIKPKLIMVITILVFIPSIYAEIQLTDFVQQNANNYLMLACEATAEAGSGCDFAEARVDHADMLEYYLGKKEDKGVLCFLLKVLYPKLSPEVQLRPVLNSLREKEGKDREQIKMAASVLCQFAKDSEESSNLRSATACYEVFLAQRLLKDVNDALIKSHEAVIEYEKNLTVDNAEKACRANRRAIALVYPIRCFYQKFVTEKRLKQFRHDIDRTIYYNNVLCKTASAEDVQLLNLYSESELRRLRIVQAILDEDMFEARRLLKEAIEKAYNTEKLSREVDSV